MPADAPTEHGFGVYVHWPYCRVICPYCDFNVYRERDGDESLLKAIAADAAGWRARIGPRRVESVYLGGGTPSRLSGGQVSTILGAVDAAWGLPSGAEITLEANPEDVTPLSVADWVSAGVNRLSIGLQALNDAALKALGRMHDAQSGVAAVQTAVAGAPRVTADLIYAREGQTLAEWEAELTRALALGPEHWSLYQLTIEPGTAFAAKAARGQLSPPDDDAAADFFDLTQSVTQAAGYRAYEISNYAREEAARSRHNRLYWRAAEWAGLGPGAHARVCVDSRRTALAAWRRPQAYAEAVIAAGWGVEICEPLSAVAVAEEALMMGLRLAEGVDRRDPRFRHALDDDAITNFAVDGILMTTGDRLVVSPAARALTDGVARRQHGAREANR